MAETAVPNPLAGIEPALAPSVDAALSRLNNRLAMLAGTAADSSDRVALLCDDPAVRTSVAIVQAAGLPLYAIPRYCPDAAVTEAELTAVLSRVAVLELMRVFSHIVRSQHSIH